MTDPERAEQDPDDLDRALDEPTGDLGPSLRALLDPPSDIRRRTARAVGRELRGRSSAELALDLLGLGLWTFRTILTDEAPRADTRGEGCEHGA